MSVAWPTRPLSECVKFSSGGTPSKKRADYWSGDIPWVSSGEMDTDRIHETSLHISEEGLEDGSRLVPKGTILAVVRGMSLAKDFRVAITMRPVAFNQDLKALTPVNGTHPRFLFYALAAQRLAIRDRASEASHGTKKLPTDVLGSVSIPQPEWPVQERIAEILWQYDDLIENNTRRIKLLEDAARLLYEEWFVRLRFPGHEHTPVKDGVPEGWERKLISDVCETVGGGTPSTKVPEYWGGDITWVVPSDITRNDCLALLDSERHITEKGLRESSAKMVPAETILMTSRASVGFFALMDHEVCTNQGFISIIPNSEELRMYMLFNLMNRVEEIRSNAKGTTYPEISKCRFRGMDIVLPSGPLVEAFSDATRDMIRQVRCLKKQSVALRAARDLLLPRLMSGEVAV